MNGVNRTLYIPLRGKASVSARGILLNDPSAEDIWRREGFPLRGKAKSRWLAYYMAMRARVFDDWTRARLAEHPRALTLHMGCGLDDRAGRLGAFDNIWYDIDFPAVIAERGKYFAVTENRRTLGADISDTAWLDALPDAREVVAVMEGVSMYLSTDALRALLAALAARFAKVYLLMDCYTVFAARASRLSNPVKGVGAEIVSGVDAPESLLTPPGMRFAGEIDMTPPALVKEIPLAERWFFRAMFAGRAAKRMYRLFAYETGDA